MPNKRKSKSDPDLAAVLDETLTAEVWDAIFAKVAQKAQKGDLAAARFLAEYRFGKPKQNLDVTSNGQTLKGYILISPDDWSRDDRSREDRQGKVKEAKSLPAPDVEEDSAEGATPSGASVGGTQTGGTDNSNSNSIGSPHPHALLAPPLAGTGLARPEPGDAVDG